MHDIAVREHENRTSSIARSSYSDVTMEADACSARPCLPPHCKEGAPRLVFIVSELASSSKAALQQVTGLDCLHSPESSPEVTPFAVSEPHHQPRDCRLWGTLEIWI
ncbi:hypothetical protein EOD39_13765 [Acipenser ruthenus]|uniref:Uncharacterized protein n=1 Tax=Acipenser ruthenus TaxID=7906 RepID=A0A662YP86_ACIRT|nr:hypothetical protein EOD39_13765 [Acipenser ruthenus]